MEKNKILASFGIILFVGLLVLVGLCINKMSTEIIEEHSFFQFFAGQKFKYNGGLKLSRKGDITELVTKDMEADLDSTPVYYDDIPNKVIFPEDMILVFPNQSGTMYKINYFSNVFYDTDVAYLENKNETKTLNNAFLFDGNDLYFFLTPITLSIGEEMFNLSPLSYVICNQDAVEFYINDKDTYITKEKSQNVQAFTNDYTINLNTDALKGKDKDQLLIKNKNSMQTYK